MNTAFPGMLDPKKLFERVCAMAAIDNVEELYAPPQQPGAAPPDPKMITAQAKVQEAQSKAQTSALTAQARLADANSKQQQAQITAQTKAEGNKIQMAGIAAKLHDSAQQREHDKALERDRLIGDAVIHNTPQADILGAGQAVDQVLQPTVTIQ
jgi:hypothetical protein